MSANLSIAQLWALVVVALPTFKPDASNPRAAPLTQTLAWFQQQPVFAPSLAAAQASPLGQLETPSSFWQSMGPNYPQTTTPAQFAIDHIMFALYQFATAVLPSGQTDGSYISGLVLQIAAAGGVGGGGAAL